VSGRRHVDGGSIREGNDGFDESNPPNPAREPVFLVKSPCYCQKKNWRAYDVLRYEDSPVSSGETAQTYK
jgi:hypothetical protein